MWPPEWYHLQDFRVLFGEREGYGHRGVSGLDFAECPATDSILDYAIEFADARSGRDNRDADHGHAEPFLKKRKIEADAPLFRFVHQVDTDEHARRDLEDLQNEVQIPLWSGGVVFPNSISVFRFS